MTTTTDTLAAAITSKQFEMEVKEGLIFILNHLDDLWPRMVSTYTTRGGQRLVNKFAEAMAWFKAANFLDCRISAYPKYTNDYISRTGIAPSVLLVDIDKEHFKTAEEFELTATRTYTGSNSVWTRSGEPRWLGLAPTLVVSNSPQKYELEVHSTIFYPLIRFGLLDSKICSIQFVCLTTCRINFHKQEHFIHTPAIAMCCCTDRHTLSNFVDVKKLPKDLLIIDNGGYVNEIRK
jgi:hypothetical protein